MKKKWIVPGLALLLLCTSCKIPDISMPDAPDEGRQAAVSNQRPPVLRMPDQKAEDPSPVPPETALPSEEDSGPAFLSAFQTEPLLTEAQMPDSYQGLELPVQGATGYASVYLPMWRAPEDCEAAQQAIAEWKKREEERRKREAEAALKRQAEEAVRQAAAQLSPSPGGAEGLSAGEADPEAAAALTAPDAPTETPASANEAAAAAPEASAAAPEASAEAPAPVPEASTAAPVEAADPTPEAPATAPAEAPGPDAEASAAAAPGTQAAGQDAAADPQPSPTAGVLAILPSGTAFTVLEEQGKWWKIQCTADYQEEGEQRHGEVVGWVEHRYCLINLPDVIPSILYDATNGYDSRFVSCGKPLKGITGQALYTGALTNHRLGEKEFMMPVLYAMAPRLCAAQRAALAQGNCLILYEGYRPLETQIDVSRALRSLMKEDPEVMAAVSSAPWSIGWFIATGASNHQQGYAVDVSLARVGSVEERSTGGCRYLRVVKFDLYQMPTVIHELSRAAVTFTTPVGSNSPTAWKSAKLAPGMNEAAIALQNYCTGASLTPLASEWWHFNDLSARSSVSGNLGKGDFEIRSCRSAAP